MFTPYRLLTQMLVLAEEVRGRKKLQKMVYIAQHLGYPFSEPFALHMWGPYSEVLALKLKEMSDWGFAREEVLPGPAGNHHYIYSPGPNAERALQGEKAAEESLASLVSYLNQQDSTLLEGVATVLFLRATGKPENEVGAALARFKPDKFTDPVRVEAAIAMADELETFRIAH